MTQIAEAFIRLRPDSSGFRAAAQTEVSRALAGVQGVPIPLVPAIAPGTPLTWERIPGTRGAVALPLKPTIAQTELQAAESAVANSVASGMARGSALGSRRLERNVSSSGVQAGAQALGGTGQRLSQQLAFFGPAGLAIGATTLAVVAAAKSFASFETELKTFGVVAQASNTELARAGDLARDLGSDIQLPAVSATDAAVAMTELAKAGLSVNDTFTGTRGVLQLATAAQIDNAAAAELAASALNAFRLPGSDATRVADLLTGAANNAQGSISDMGLALRQAAAVSRLAGFNIDETVTSLTILAKAGIQGSDAGTSLRTALLRLIAPTTEASRVLEALGVQIRDQNGDIKPDAFFRLREAMEGLSPAVRQTALATIFGADAIRAATFLTEQSAASFGTLEKSVTRAGQAQEITKARTDGLGGSFQALKSEAETAAVNVGQVLAPELEGLAVGAGIALSGVNLLADGIRGLAHVGAGEPPPRTVAQIAKELDEAKARAAEGLQIVVDQDGGVQATIKRLTEELHNSLSPALKAATTDAKGFKTSLADAADRDNLNFSLSPALTAGTADAAERAGITAGKKFGKGVGDGIDSSEQSIIASARKAVAAAQKALADTIAQGQDAIAAAAAQAKSNLAAIGTELSQQAVDILDSGPLAARITQLQRQLDRMRGQDQRRSLRSGLKTAEQELADAEKSVAIAGPRTKEQDEAIDRFLRPFREKVADAKAALAEFNTEGVITKLQATLDRQKTAITKGIADVIAAFNAGSIDANTANRRIAGVLGAATDAYGKAGTKLGVAFRSNFTAQLAGLRAQINEIVAGPQTTKKGNEPTIVSPSKVAAGVAQDVAEARAALVDSQTNLRKTIQDATKKEKENTDASTSVMDRLIESINANTRARGGTAPRGTTAPTPTTSGRR